MGYKRKETMKLKILIIIVLSFFLLQTGNGQKVLTLNAGHTGAVNALSYSHDGKYIVSGSDDNTIKLWDVGTGQVIRTFRGHKARVESVEFSSDGKYIVSGSYDKTIKYWNVETGQEIKTFSGHDDCNNLSVCPEKYFLFYGNNTIELYDIKTGAEIGIIEYEDYCHGVNCSPNGKYVVSEHLKGMQIWNSKTGQEITRLKRNVNADISFSQDEKYIASYSKNQIIIWDIETGQKIRTFLGHNSYVNSVVFSSNGKNIVSASSDKTVKLWNIETGQEITTLMRHHGSVKKAFFHQDEKYIVSVSRDARKKYSSKDIITLWDIETGQKIKSFSGGNVVNSVVFSADGKFMASGEESGSIKIWDIETEREIKTFSDNYIFSSNKTFSLDGKHFVSYYPFKLWDEKTGKEIRIFKDHFYSVKSAVFSSDGKYIVSGDNKGLIKLWNVETGKETRTFTGHTNAVNTLSYSHDGKYIVSGSDDNTIKFWNVETGQEIKTFTGHDASVESIVFSPDEKIIISGSNNTIKLWDVETGQEIKTFKRTGNDYLNKINVSPNGQYFLSNFIFRKVKLWNTKTGRKIRTYKDAYGDMVFNPDGKKFISTYAGGGDIKLWNVETEKEVRNFSGHDGMVNNVIFSSDGKNFISGSDDNTIKLWNVETGQEIRTFIGHSSSVTKVAFQKNEKFIRSEGPPGTIKTWETTTGKLLFTKTYLANSTDWVIYTPDGRFDGTEKGMDLFNYVDGMEVIPLSSLYTQYYTPNLLARVLQGEKFEEILNVQELLPQPSVEITSPTINTSNQLFKTHSTGNFLATREKINIEYEVTDNGGGINEIRIYQNGSLIESDDFVEVDGGITKKTATISLIRNAENIIRITAYNEQRTEAIPQEISIYYEGVKATSDLYLFCIGIDDYENDKYDLTYAKADAEKFISSIKTGKSFLFFSSKHFIYNKWQVLSFFNQLFTKRRFKKIYSFKNSQYFTLHIIFLKEWSKRQKKAFLPPKFQNLRMKLKQQKSYMFWMLVSQEVVLMRL